MVKASETGFRQLRQTYFSLQEQQQILDIFNSTLFRDFSTKQMGNQKGMGLGLAICYSIIKKHNGHISINSGVGKGTTVELVLPAYLPTHDNETNLYDSQQTRQPREMK